MKLFIGNKNRQRPGSNSTEKEEYMDSETSPDFQEVLDGAGAYTPMALLCYDAIVYVTCRFFWRCHKHEILRRYQNAVGRSHLELGVGTGYCPAHTRFPGPDPEITLVDLNEHTLQFASRRLSQFRLRRIKANLLQPLTAAGVPVKSFDSVALNLLLHCIPGNLNAKKVVIVNAATAVKPGGTVVGSTILSNGVEVSVPGRLLMRQLNAKGIFHNTDDSLADLECLLEKYFASHTLEVRGCMALFTAIAH